MNPQELFIDVSSGRFLDGESTIAIAKPSVFSDEQKTIQVNVLKVQKNIVSPVDPSPNARYKVRLGTPSLKLSDAIDVSTAPPQLFTAQATIVTKASSSATASSTITTYSPVTASFNISIVTFPIVTATFIAKINNPNPVTATFTGTISSVTIPGFSTIRQTKEINDSFLPAPFSALGPLIFTATLNSPVTATFLATITGGVVTTISIVNDGEGYLDGQYFLSFSGGSPSSVASASVVAKNGEISSVSIIDGGTGYGSAPSVTLFAPAKRISSLSPTGLISNTASGSIFSWTGGVSIGTRVDLIFSGLDNITTPTNTSVPSAFIVKLVDSNRWQLTLASQGYGYSAIPTVTHGPVLVNLAERRYRVTTLTTPISPLQETVIIATSRIIGTTLLSNGGLPFDEIETRWPSKDFSFWKNWRIANASAAQRRTTFTGSSVIENESYLVAPRIPGTTKIAQIIGKYSIGPSGYASPPSPISPIQNDVSLEGYTFYAVAHIPNKARPQRYAICKIEYGKIDYSLQVTQATGKSGSAFSSYGGGVFDVTITWLDFGEGYPSNATDAPVLIPIEGIQEGQFYSSLINQQFTVTTGDGYYNTILSSVPSVVSENRLGSIAYSIKSPGFGFGKDSGATISSNSTSVSGGLTSIALTNSPSGYVNSITEYTTVTPAGGTAAKYLIVTSPDGVYGYVRETGFNFTVAPTITAPAPNDVVGKVISITNVTRPSGYSTDTDHLISFAGSPVSGGTAQAAFKISADTGLIQTTILNPGFGYQTAPIATAITPDLISKNGRVDSISLANKPIGYVIGQEYDLLIDASPATGGSALATFTKTNETNYSINLLNAGFGYTSTPNVTAPGPDAPQGELNTVSIVCAGGGYAPGAYNANVDKAPSGGETAIVNFIVDSSTRSRMEILRKGFGYVTAPNITVPTPQGNVISNITITCNGNFYTNETALFSIEDGSGSGALISPAILSSGKILGANVLDGGYGYSDKPIISFNPPTAPEEKVLPRNVIEGTLNITTASANAILTTANQRDILLEVYETDGTNEQVVVQGTVNLAKRVLE